MFQVSFFVILEVIEEEVKRMLQLTIPEIILRLVLAMVMLKHKEILMFQVLFHQRL
jgi:hypothetical protein